MINVLLGGGRGRITCLIELYQHVTEAIDDTKHLATESPISSVR